MKKNLFFAMLASLVLCGCGYTTHSVIPGNQRSIHVDNFVNKIKVTSEISDRKMYYAYKPAMELDITREVIDRFLFDGIYKIKDAKNAYFLLKGQLVDYRREPLSYDDSDNVTEYRLSVVVNLELYRTKDKELVWQEKKFAGENTYPTAGQGAKSENTALDEAIRDLARRIVERTVENW